MADVAQKAISANSIYNNRVVVVTSPKKGMIQTKSNGDNKYIDVAVLESKFDNRFDDKNFYSN